MPHSVGARHRFARASHPAQPDEITILAHSQQAIPANFAKKDPAETGRVVKVLGEDA